MNREQSILTSRGLTDARDRLVSADEPLASLQRDAGGTVPGALAVPELLDLVRQAREIGLKIARDFSAFNGTETVRGFARIHPQSEANGGGCEILVENWQRSLEPLAGAKEIAALLDEIDRSAAEVTGRLDARQRVQYLNSDAADAKALCEAIEAKPGKLWSDYLDKDGADIQQPLHWRVLDATRCSIPGSTRDWRVRLIPVGSAEAAPHAFELLLIADQLLPEPSASDDADTAHSRLMGSALTPVLREPIARVIANAETIRARLAGPLRAEYSEYAGHIASAGQHLSAMLDDLVDLEVVEAADFSTAKERVDLVDAARRAVGILGVRAQARSIEVVLPEDAQDSVAIGEFRRVLQILINLVGNAIAYSPEGSTVAIDIEPVHDGAVSLIVQDEGPGVDPEQARRVFDKFERLGRDSDVAGEGGSGLGLYISRRLARVMGGDLECVAPSGSAQRRGATFRLSLPAAPPHQRGTEGGQKRP